MTSLMVNAVPLRPRPVVPAITKLLATLPAALPVPTLAAILVIAVVPMNVPEGQRTIPAPMLQQPNAGQPVVTVKTVLPEVPHIPVLMSDLPNAVTVIPVPIPAVPVRSPCLVPLLIIKYAYLQQNAEQAVTNVNTILTVP